MPRRLPPLNALKAFEAAGRHLSFTRAAAELNVTQAAISHQVKGLEETLGAPLFRRLNRALKLTDAGQTLLPALSESFDAIAEAARRLGAEERAGVLTVSTLDSLAASWLVPRLGRFRGHHPDIDVRISTSDQVVDFAASGIDMAVRYGRGEYPGCEAVRLMTETLFPVLSPGLLKRLGGLSGPADLVRYPLLHDDMRDDWAVWMQYAGVPGADVSRGPFFGHSNLVVQAAIAGEGVALGRSVLVADSLTAGLLVKPFAIDMPAHHAYWCVTPKTGVGRPKVGAFRDWLIAEAAETQERSERAVSLSNLET